MTQRYSGILPFFTLTQGQKLMGALQPFSESEVVEQQCWAVLEEVPLSRLCVKGGPQCQTLKTSSQDNGILRFFIKSPHRSVYTCLPALQRGSSFQPCYSSLRRDFTLLTVRFEIHALKCCFKSPAISKNCRRLSLAGSICL